MSVILNYNNNKSIQVLNGRNNMNNTCDSYILKLDDDKYLFARTYNADDALEQICEEVFPSSDDDIYLQKLLNEKELKELKNCYIRNTQYDDIDIQIIKMGMGLKNIDVALIK